MTEPDAGTEGIGPSTGETVLWWVCLGLAPLVLAGIEMFHPAGFTSDPGMVQYLSTSQPRAPQNHALAYPGPEWWFWLHMIQTVMVGLVCIGLWQMVARVRAPKAAVVFALLARIAVFITFVYFTVLDAIGGIGLGRSLIVAKELADSGQLTAEQHEGAVILLNTTWVDPWSGGVGSFVSQTASWGAFVSSILVAVTLLLTRRAPVVPLVLLVAVFGWQLQVAHVAMHGPLAFSALFVAAARIWFRRDAVRERSGISWV